MQSKLALEPSLPLVVAVRRLAGAGEAAFAVAVLTVAADLAPSDRRGEAMSLVTTASYLGLTVGPVVADFVLGDGRFALTWLLAAGLVLGAVAAVTRYAGAFVVGSLVALSGLLVIAAATLGKGPRRRRGAVT